MPGSGGKCPESPRTGSSALDHVRLVQIERDREEEQPSPPVHGVERERLLVADQVAHEPDEEPEQGHAQSISGTPDRGIGGHLRGPIPQVPTSPTHADLDSEPHLRTKRPALAGLFVFRLRAASLRSPSRRNPWFPRVPPPCWRRRWSHVFGADLGGRHFERLL